MPTSDVACGDWRRLIVSTSTFFEVLIFSWATPTAVLRRPPKSEVAERDVADNNQSDDDVDLARGQIGRLLLRLV